MTRAGRRRARSLAIATERRKFARMMRDGYGFRRGASSMFRIWEAERELHEALASFDAHVHVVGTPRRE